MHNKRSFAWAKKTCCQNRLIYIVGSQLCQVLAKGHVHARLPTVLEATQDLWVRVCRFNYIIGPEVAEMTVRRVCQRHGIDIAVALPAPWTGGCCLRKIVDGGRAC